MKTILIPVFNDRVSSRLDCSEYFLLIKINDKIIQNRETIKIITKNQLEKLNIILSMKPATIICNGLPEFYKVELLKNKIEIIPWVSGQLEDVIQSFMIGTLANTG